MPLNFLFVAGPPNILEAATRHLSEFFPDLSLDANVSASANSELSSLIALYLQQATQSPPKPRATLSLSVTDGTIFIPLDEIRHIKADGPYSTIYYGQGKQLVVARTLKALSERLSHPPFERVHHSHLVNLLFVEKIHRDGYMVLTGEERINISRANRQRVMDALLAMRTF